MHFKVRFGPEQANGHYKSLSSQENLSVLAHISSAGRGDLNVTYNVAVKIYLLLIFRGKFIFTYLSFT